MRPLFLRMQAFCSYPSEQIIDFSPLGSSALFLIHGATGSGKSAVLDAISYALYGVAATEKRSTRDLRSHLSESDCRTEVSFDFSLGSRRFRVMRSPEQKIAKKRGTGLKEEPASAVLWEQIEVTSPEKEGRVLADGVREVSQRIEELLGFSFEHFTRLIVIPQGEFKRLILAPVSERKEIFEKLFQSELYRRIEESLRTKYRAVENSRALLLERKKALLAREELPSIEALAEQLALDRKRLEELLESGKLIQSELEERRAEESAALEIKRRINEHKEAGAALELLKKQESEYQAAKKHLQEARKAAAVEGTYITLQRSEAVLQETEKTFVVTIEEHKKATLAYTVAVNNAAEAIRTGLEEAKETEFSRDERYQDLKQRWIASQASRLALDLKPGIPCPVCGSLEHPSPAGPGEEIIKDDAFNEAESKLERARRDVQELSIKFAAIEGLVLGPAERKPRKENLAEEIKQREAALKKASEELAQAESRKAALKSGYEADKRDLEHVHQEFNLALSKNGFPNLEAFLASRLKSEEIEALDATVTAFQGNKAAAEDRLARAFADISSLAVPDLDAIEQKRSLVEQKYAVINFEKGGLQHRIQSSENSLKEAEAIERDLMDNEKACVVAKDLFDIASGNNEKRMSFQAYVLTALLQDVLLAANERLRIMSEGRYELALQDGPVDRRLQGGLDINVFDQYTGLARSSGSLSGGECFLASLSLALGLSDVVQSYSGGIRMDTIFIDEGFGTLDAEALEHAVTALVSLQKGGKIVGVISHLAELLSLIETRLEITKTAGGSIARWRMP